MFGSVIKFVFADTALQRITGGVSRNLLKMDTTSFAMLLALLVSITDVEEVNCASIAVSVYEGRPAVFKIDTHPKCKELTLYSPKNIKMAKFTPFGSQVFKGVKEICSIQLLKGGGVNFKINQTKISDAGTYQLLTSFQFNQHCVALMKDFVLTVIYTGPHWSPWEPWGSCSGPCSDGYKTRQRTCVVMKNKECIGSNTESVKCPAPECVEWMPWSNWSLCAGNCGGETRQRVRNCAQNSAEKEMKDSCFSNHTETDMCNKTCTESKDESDDSKIVIIVGSIVGGIVIIVIVIVLIIWRKKKLKAKTSGNRVYTTDASSNPIYDECGQNVYSSVPDIQNIPNGTYSYSSVPGVQNATNAPRMHYEPLRYKPCGCRRGRTCNHPQSHVGGARDNDVGCAEYSGLHTYDYASNSVAVNRNRVPAENYYITAIYSKKENVK